jgi:hypothetical protein
VPAGYRVAPIFLIRMAGVPFEVTEELATPATFATARKVLAKQLGQLETTCPGSSSAAHPGNECDASWEELNHILEKDLRMVRAALFRSAQKFLPNYLIFTTGGARQLLEKLLAGTLPSLERRNARDGDRERHVLLYLQRIATKNDTFSEFGPSSWGRVESGAANRIFLSSVHVTMREVFLERWTAHAAAAALNADPTVQIELAPRVHPNGRIEGDHFIFTDSGKIISFDSAAKGIVSRCDGKTPAHSLGDFATLRQLAAQKIVKWEVEVPALDPHAFATMLFDIAQWRQGPTRKYWLATLQPLAALCEEFAGTDNVISRNEIMQKAASSLHELGASTQSPRRFLYNAANAIGEDCSCDCAFTIGEEMLDEVVREAGPWIDVWRDAYAYIASRVAAGLRGLFQSGPVKDGTIALPAFLQHCETQKMSLTGHGLVALAHIAFLELKNAFQNSLGERTDAAEWTLSADDCRFVRKNFEYPAFDEYTFPSADLQISAASIEHVNRGEYEWILAELHPPIAMLHHCMYWSCPDKPAFARSLASTTCGQPNFFYGFAPADFTAHTTVRQFDVIPELSYFVAPRRGKPDWQIIPTAETEVFINEENGDVALRKRGSREYLGSFSRYWIIPLGFHPFYFGRAPHMPRLRCGRVIVQRESWTVTASELCGGNFTGVSPDLVIAIEQLRAQRGLPRFVYIRPTEQALRRSGAEGRDKDTKPVFIDLESYLFVEIFHRWLMKAGEIEVTEMLPDPNHLLWQGKDGRRTFELRTLIVPRE